MSWGYWGIVAGLAAMVATFFICIEILYSNVKGSPQAPSSMTDRPVEAVKQASVSHRRAA